MQTNNTNNENETQRINLKPPTYFEDDNGSPLKWIHYTKTVLQISGINSNNAICYFILSNFPSKITAEIAEYLEPIRLSKDPLQKLISTISDKYRINKRHILDSCVNSPLLGDQRPSEMLRKLKYNLELVQPNITSAENHELLKECFLRSLPTDTRRILAATQTTSLEDLGAIADKIHKEQTPNVSFINKHHQNKPINDETANTLKEIVKNQNEMLKQFNLLLLDNKNTLDEIKQIKIQLNYSNNNNHASNPNNYRNRSQSPTRNTRHEQNNTNKTNDNNYCYFHDKYKEKAFKCQEPCNWSTTHSKK